MSKTVCIECGGKFAKKNLMCYLYDEDGELIDLAPFTSTKLKKYDYDGPYCEDCMTENAQEDSEDEEEESEEEYASEEEDSDEEDDEDDSDDY